MKFSEMDAKLTDTTDPDQLILNFLISIVQNKDSSLSRLVVTLRTRQIGRRVVAAVSEALVGGGYIFLVEAIEQPCFILMNSNFSDGPPQVIVDQIVAAYHAAAVKFGAAEHTIVIDMSDIKVTIPTNTLECAKAFLIRVPTHAQGAQLLSILGHELAHCYFRSGNRFLDEAIAQRFEKTLSDAREFPFKLETKKACIESAISRGVFPRALFAWDLRSDPLLNTLAEANISTTDFYGLAHLLGETCDQVAGDVLAGLARAVSAEPDTAKHASIFEKFVGTSLEQAIGMVCRSMQTILPEVTGAVHLESNEVLRRQLMLNPDNRDRYLAQLRQAAEKNDDPSILIELHKSLVDCVLDSYRLEHALPPITVYLEARSIFHSVQRVIDPCQKDLALARLNVCSLFGYEPLKKVVDVAMRCYRSFERLQIRWPESPEVLFACAHYYFSIPQEYGGGRGRYAECIEKLRDSHPNYASLLLLEPVAAT